MRRLSFLPDAVLWPFHHVLSSNYRYQRLRVVPIVGSAPRDVPGDDIHAKPQASRRAGWQKGGEW